MAQPLAQEKLYTEADYYNLPADVRAELTLIANNAYIGFHYVFLILM